ncbi:unnamed protein product (macronuclear) [Paramecium tetraurelia]|uniref:Response regulatory domain-containing protein n=2 Tax=Paramecium tetraurelia TaxID=5888 RepID=A0D983_PARTE|nr:uncharacterized protein GSPATT00039341001 [Paramecium tetraurelia]CAK79600.1 unnamed protein product [Paramecium tetraurelia]|eukprot:XP_001446997.1 hypothetical protein (macronuclear) [Paramecium tetraurelia strain d4-2]
MILIIFTNIASNILEFWKCEQTIEYVFLSISLSIDVFLIALTMRNQYQYLIRLLLIIQTSIIFSIFKDPKFLAIMALYQCIMRQIIQAKIILSYQLVFFILIGVLSTKLEVFDIIRTTMVTFFFVGYQIQVFFRQQQSKVVEKQTEQITIKMETEQIVIQHQQPQPSQTQRQGNIPEIILDDFLSVIQSNKKMNEILTYFNYDDPNNLLQEIKIINIDSVSERKLGKWREDTLMSLLKKIISRRSEIQVQVLEYNHSLFQKYLILVHYKNQFEIQFIQVNERDTFIKKKYLSQILYQLFKTFSHEFGTLLNYLLALSQVAIDRFPNQVGFFQPIKSTGQIMHHFVQDMVDYSDILNKKFQLQFGLVDVEDLLQEGLIITYQIMLEEKAKFFDGRRCKQVLSNLIANAQKFTVSGGIKITVTEQSGFTIFSVEDSGFGMTQETFDNLNQTLETEFKSEQKISQHTAGFGLGCYLSQQIALKLSNLPVTAGGGLKYVRLEKGIRVSFRVKNQPFEIFYTSCDISSAKSGILFNENGYFDSRQSVIDLQLTNRHKPADNHLLLTLTKKSSLLSASFSPNQIIDCVEPELKQDNEIIERIRQRIITRKREGQKQSPTFGASVADIASVKTIREQPHILIVDDEMINIISLKILLSQFNIKCTSAFNGLEAVNKIKESNEKFNVIFMDVNMPIMDGFQATEQILKFDNDNTIVACTAFSDVETKTKCYSVGMKYYINKPVTMFELLKLLNHLNLIIQ